MSENGIKKELLRSASVLGLLCGAHVGSMMALENLNFMDSLWLTLTTAATVGYGDLSAKTMPGRIATMAMMYSAGVFVVAQTASNYFAFRQNKRDTLLNGKWNWNMENHIVILNAPDHNPVGFFKKFMEQLRSSALPAAQKAALIVSPDFKEALPDELRRHGVANVNENTTDKIAFDHSNLKKASIVVILCRDEEKPESDSITFDLISRARAENPKAVIIAESISDENRMRFAVAGANHVVRPIRAYPELLVRTITAPGTEKVIEEMFNSQGEECVRYDLSLKGVWGKYAMAMMSEDIGTPLAIIDMKDQIIPNPNPRTEVEGKGVIVLVRAGNVKRSEDVSRILHPSGAAQSGQALRL